MSYKANKAAAIYRSSKPTKTDQSAAKDTDINVIMKQYNMTGFIPGSSTPPTFGDYTKMRDLKGMLDLTRNLRNEHGRLHADLQKLPLNQLLALTPEQINNILTPPAPTPAPPTNNT